MKKILIIILFPFMAQAQTITEALKSIPDVVAAVNATNAVTVGDIQRIRDEVYNTFDLYERQLAICNQAKETIRIISLKSMEEQLKELDRIKNAIANQQSTIETLMAIKEDLNKKLSSLNKSLRKVKRRAIISHVFYNSVIAAIIISQR